MWKTQGHRPVQKQIRNMTRRRVIPTLYSASAPAGARFVALFACVPVHKRYDAPRESSIQLHQTIYSREDITMSQQPPQGPQGPQQRQPQPPQGPQQGYQQFPQQPPPKRKRRGLLIVGIVVAVVLFGCVGASYAASQAMPTVTTSASVTATGTTPTGTAGQVGQKPWKTTHTITGSGIKKTEVFTLAPTWKLLWTCNPASFSGGQYNMIVSVYDASNAPVDVAINAICKAGTTGGQTEEHTGGAVYLDVNSEGDWTLQVQEHV